MIKMAFMNIYGIFIFYFAIWTVSSDKLWNGLSKTMDYISYLLFIDLFKQVEPIMLINLIAAAAPIDLPQRINLEMLNFYETYSSTADISYF